MGKGWKIVEMARTCLGGFLLEGSNAEKWGAHRKKNLFINNSVGTLILLKEGHQGLLKLHVHLEGFQCGEKMGLSPKSEFYLKRKDTV